MVTCTQHEQVKGKRSYFILVTVYTKYVIEIIMSYILKCHSKAKELELLKQTVKVKDRQADRDGIEIGMGWDRIEMIRGWR